MLVLTAAALAKITARGRNAVRRWLKNPQQTRPRKALFDLDQLNLHLLAGRDKRHKNNKITSAPDAFAAEGDVVDV